MRLESRILVLMFMTINTACLAQGQHAKPGTQIVFGMESHPIKNPIDVPITVLDLLKSDPVVKDCLDYSEKSDPPSSWFVASAIRLQANRQGDLIVLPRDLSPDNNSCLFHVHSIPVWIFIKTRNGHELALTDNTQVVEIQKTASHSYHDIRTSMTILSGEFVFWYKFDGHRYALFKKWRKDS